MLLMMMAIMMVIMMMTIIMIVMLIIITINIMIVEYICHASLNVMQIKISFAAAYDFNQYTQYVPRPGPSQPRRL